MTPRRDRRATITPSPSLALHYAQFRPHRQLASWVECYWRLSDDGVRVDAPRPQRILPDGYVEIIVHRGDPFARVDVSGAPAVQPRFLFVGQMIQPIRVLETGRTRVWGVRLHPWAASVVAGMPAYELTGRIERSDDVCPRLARDLVDALDRADDGGADEDVARGVQELDRVLQSHLARAVPLDPLAVAAGGMLLRQPRPIAEMAGRLGVSVRQLERAFQHAVGLTPKMFARISRFQRVAAMLDGAPEEAPASRLAAVALECGYYDQSHLVRDVRAFAGDTPVALREALDGELAEYFLRARRASHFSKIDPVHVD